MPAKRNFDAQLAALDELRRRTPEERVDPLRKGLAQRNNFVAAKAADLVREFNLVELIPELLAAFDRFLADPAKTDPQCWAKNSLSRTLAAFEHQDANIFLRGMRHIQNEPVWGGQSDTAGTLRATCALALVQCRSLPEDDLLRHLIELFADKDKSVRVEAARAVEHVGSAASPLLLRLRASLGNDEPEVLGACFSGVLQIEGARAISWVGQYLTAGDDTAAEAALAIAATHTREAFTVLQEQFEKTSDPWFRGVLLSAIALVRLDAAVEFLLELVRTESLQAEAAIEAILRSVPSGEVTNRLEKIVEGNPRLARVFSQHRSTR